MTRQDGDDSPPTDAEPTGDEQASEATTETEREADDALEDIAEEPTADIEEVLEEIMTPTAESADDETQSEDESEEDLIEFIEETPSEQVAAAVRTLTAERAELAEKLAAERERAEELKSRLSRKQADFQNYKKRQEQRLEEQKQRATEDLVGRLLEVRDNLARALDQDEDTEIRSGVETTLNQFDEELDRENVSVIEPAPGSEVDPQRHEVLITVESDQPEGTVAQLNRPGYEMAGKVLRPAQVAVSDGTARDESEGKPEDQAAEE